MRPRNAARQLRRALLLGAALLLLPAPSALLAHDPITTKVTWEREIAPLFQARCVSCHSPDGRGPMSLATYDEARPWARAIREEVLARRMPKWHAMRGFGDFENDPSLSAFEIALITAWVDGGAPRTAVPKRPATAARPGPPRSAPARDALATEPVLIRCTPQGLPVGRLVALTPTTEAGASIRLVLEFPDGRAEPLLWIRGFDPEFPHTYRLRTPARLVQGTRLAVEATAAEACRLALDLASE